MSIRDRLYNVQVSGPIGRRHYVLEKGNREEIFTEIAAINDKLGEAYWTRRTIQEDDPNSAKMVTGYSSSFQMAGENVKLISEVYLHSDKDAFFYNEKFIVFRNGKKMIDKNWDKKIKRQFV